MSRIKQITIIAAFSAILFVQEEALTFLPNVQLTVFLLILYSKVFGFKNTAIIVCIHTLLDNIVMGSLNIIYFPFMLIGWLLIPIIVCSLLKKCNNSFILASFSIIFSFVYCWIFMIPNIIFYSIDIKTYLISDILWEIVLAISSFLTTLWLYNPCESILNRLVEN